MTHDPLVLRLERRDQAAQPMIGAISLTPPVNEDFWGYRVQLGHGQAVLGFPKHGTVGVGFALEDDWNTNLPYRCETDYVVSHILHNKRYECISDEDVRAAVLLVQEAAAFDIRDPRGGVGSLGPAVKVPHPVDDDDEEGPRLLPCPDETVAEPLGPTTLAEWYAQLVDAASNGNADAFEAEVDRIVRLSVEHLISSAQAAMTDDERGALDPEDRLTNRQRVVLLAQDLGNLHGWWDDEEVGT